MYCKEPMVMLCLAYILYILKCIKKTTSGNYVCLNECVRCSVRMAQELQFKYIQWIEEISPYVLELSFSIFAQHYWIYFW